MTIGGAHRVANQITGGAGALPCHHGSLVSVPPLQQLHLQKTTIAREFTEKLEKFVTFLSRIFVRKELNALLPGLLSD